MRALRIHELTGPDGIRLDEVPEPADPDAVLLDVRAAGVAFPDVLLSQGKYQLKPPVPFIPGCEVAGVVRTAPASSPLRPGDRAAGFLVTGGYAEVAAVPAPFAVPIPQKLDFAAGAALILNYHTAHFALARRGGLRSGDTLVVHGAGGGVGTAAIQVGKGLGARVIAVVHREAGAEVAAEMGADEVLPAGSVWRDGVRELTGGRGADVVLDPVGGDAFDESLRCLAPEGRLLVVGFAAGRIPELTVNRLLLRNVSAVGVAWGAFLQTEPGLFQTTGQALAELADAGYVRPHIGARYPLERGAEAVHDLAAGRVLGKAVLDL